MAGSMFPQYKLEGQQRHQNIMDKQVDGFTPVIGDILFSEIVNLDQTPEYANLKYGDKAPHVGELIHRFPSMQDAVFCHREYITDGSMQQQYRFWFIVPPRKQWKYNAELKPASPQKHYTLIIHKKDHERNISINPIAAYMLPDDAEYVVPEGKDENNGYYIVSTPSDEYMYYDIERTYVTLRPIVKKEVGDGLEETFFKPVPLIKVYTRDPDENYAADDCFYVQKIQTRFDDRKFDNIFVQELHRYMTLPGPVEYKSLYQNAYGNEDPVVTGADGHAVQRNTMAKIIPPMPYECFYNEDGSEKQFIYEWEDFGSGESDRPAVKKFSLVTPYKTAGRYPSEQDSDGESSQCCDIPDRFVLCRYTGSVTMMKGIYEGKDYDERGTNELPTREEKREQVIAELKAEIERRINDKQLEQQGGDESSNWAVTQLNWDIDWKNYDTWREEVEVSCKYVYVHYSTESLESWEITGSGKKVRSKSCLVKNEDVDSHVAPYQNLQSVIKNRVSGCATEISYKELDDGKNAVDEFSRDENLQKVPDQAKTDVLARTFFDEVTLLIGDATYEQRHDENGNTLSDSETLRNMARETILHYEQLHEEQINDWRDEADEGHFSFLDYGHDAKVDLRETKAIVSVKTKCTLTRWITNASIGYATDERTSAKIYTYEVTSFKEAVEAMFGISIGNNVVSLGDSANPLAKKAEYVSFSVGGIGQWVSAKDLDDVKVERITKPNNGDNNGSDMYIYRVTASGGSQDEELLLSYETTRKENLPSILNDVTVKQATGFFQRILYRDGTTRAYCRQPFIQIKARSGGSVTCIVKVDVYFVPKIRISSFFESHKSTVPIFSGQEERVSMSHPLANFSFDGLLKRQEMIFTNGDRYNIDETFAQSWGDGYINTAATKTKNGIIATVENIYFPQ